MSADEKGVYEERNRVAKETYLDELKKLGLTEKDVKEMKKKSKMGTHAPQEGQGDNELVQELLVPTAVVKRVMNLDSDFRRITGEGTLCVIKATELFVQFLSRQVRNTMGHKRSTLKQQDFFQTIKHNELCDFLQLGSMPLPDGLDLPAKGTSPKRAAPAKAAGGRKKQKTKGKGKADTGRSRKISQMFGK